MPDRRLIEFARRRGDVAAAPEPPPRRTQVPPPTPVGLYVADFYAASAALVVEVDGDTHATDEGIEHDRVRHTYLESLGLVVVRFWNTEVKENPDAVLDRVCELCLGRQGARRRLLRRVVRERGADENEGGVKVPG